MADIAKLSSGIRPADIPERQLTTRCSVEIDEGTPVYLDTNGEWAIGDASAAPGADFYGILLEHGYAREYRTAVAKGPIAGYDLSGQDIGDTIYLSDTAGTLADAAGTVSVEVGQVIPGTANGYPPFNKLLEVG